MALLHLQTPFSACQRSLPRIVATKRRPAPCPSPFRIFLCTFGLEGVLAWSRRLPDRLACFGSSHPRRPPHWSPRLLLPTLQYPAPPVLRDPVPSSLIPSLKNIQARSQRIAHSLHSPLPTPSAKSIRRMGKSSATDGKSPAVLGSGSRSPPGPSGLNGAGCNWKCLLFQRGFPESGRVGSGLCRALEDEREPGSLVELMRP